MFKKRNIYIMIIFFLIIILEKMFNKFDPYLQDLKNTNLGMFKKGHILGTDILGRDILSRLTQGLMITIFSCILFKKNRAYYFIYYRSIYVYT